ncbi:MAG: chemotaxis response regulator protein-glutamate methylesterase [Bacteroidota bacterium]|nr:chemotaxis response regulator protein-glutamate methylesterase [Bacteroidota bacterium]
MKNKNKIKVLIVDDSATVREFLKKIINDDPDLEVIETASNPYFAAKKISKETPDVITLDIDMPRMDGITFLKKIMKQHPIPVVMISSLTENNSKLVLKAIDYGAVEVINKPTNLKEFLNESTVLICDKIKAAMAVKNQNNLLKFKSVSKKLSVDVIIAKKKIKNIQLTNKVIIIGASTGGTMAITNILRQLPQNSPPIVIVQHMPKNFTTAFAKRLNSICNIEVTEASNNEEIKKGKAIIAHGDFHLLINKINLKYYVQLKKGELVNRHRPSVDVLFRSAAQTLGKNAIGIILTGMGDDGAKSLLEMKEAGAFTIAQDEESSVVFGMPRKAIELDPTIKILPINQIASFIINFKK